MSTDIDGEDDSIMSDIICFNCEHLNEEGAKICENCGADLSETITADSSKIVLDDYEDNEEIDIKAPDKDMAAEDPSELDKELEDSFFFELEPAEQKSGDRKPLASTLIGSHEDDGQFFDTGKAGFGTKMLSEGPDSEIPFIEDDQEISFDEESEASLESTLPDAELSEKKEAFEHGADARKKADAKRFDEPGAVFPESTGTPSPLPRRAKKKEATRDAGKLRQQVLADKEMGKNIFGIYGPSDAGKSCFLYSLKKLIARSKEIEGYKTSGTNWKALAENLEEGWKKKIDSDGPVGHGRPTRKFEGYNASGNKDHRDIVMYDIPGELFDRIDSWYEDDLDLDVFISLVPNCNGFFLFFNIFYGQPIEIVFEGDEFDEEDLEPAGEQLGRSLDFLQTVAVCKSDKALIESEDSPQDRVGKFLEIYEKYKKKNKFTPLNVPVVLCLSKSDLTEKCLLAELEHRSPVEFSPWDFMKKYYRERLKDLMQIAPKLKIEWVSSLGRNFDAIFRKSVKSGKRAKIGKPLGVKAAFDHVVTSPPPLWTLRSSTYYKLRKLFLL